MAAAQAWIPLVNLSAVGGVILFVSAMCYVGVLLGTMLVMPRGALGADRVHASRWSPVAGASIWDRLGLWTAVAVVLILLGLCAAALSPPHHGAVSVPGFAPF